MVGDVKKRRVKMCERKSYEDVIKMIERNAKDILSPDAGERSIKRVEGCLLAILCETMLDIREELHSINFSLCDMVK
jgi:exoribonuclease R